MGDRNGHPFEMNAERNVHRTALALFRGGCERNVQYRQALPKRQHLHIIHIGRYELTERFFRSVDEETKRDGIYIIKRYRERKLLTNPLFHGINEMPKEDLKHIFCIQAIKKGYSHSLYQSF